MRLHIGEIPDSPDFVPDDSWTLMVEPTPWIMQLLSLPVGLTLALALGVLWMTLTPLGHSPAPSVGGCFGVLLAVVPAHEALHLVISLVPLIACALTATAFAFLAVASVVNAFFASGDLFAVALLLAQVPPQATLRNKGWRVCWKV
jgi:hypothetical protein